MTVRYLGEQSTSASGAIFFQPHSSGPLSSLGEMGERGSQGRRWGIRYRGGNSLRGCQVAVAVRGRGNVAVGRRFKLKLWVGVEVSMGVGNRSTGVMSVGSISAKG